MRLLVWSVLSIWIRSPSERLLRYHETLNVHFGEGRLVSPVFVPLLRCEGMAEVARSIVQRLGDHTLHASVPGDYLHGHM